MTKITQGAEIVVEAAWALAAVLAWALFAWRVL